MIGVDDLARQMANWLVHGERRDVADLVACIVLTSGPSRRVSLLNNE